MVTYIEYMAKYIPEIFLVAALGHLSIRLLNGKL